MFKIENYFHKKFAFNFGWSIKKELKVMKFTRKEFYDLVWSKSLTQLSKEYNISDNGLRHVCEKNNIPTPKMGHWQKVQYGKKLQIIPLPKVEEPNNIEIELGDKEEHVLSKQSRISKEIEAQFPDLIEVSSELINPCKLVREAQKDLRTKKSISWRGHKECMNTSFGILSISVEKSNLQRMLCFVDAFIKLLMKRGHEIINEGHATLIIVDGERYKIRFREKHTREQFIDDRSWSYSELIPNGKLSLKYDDLYDKEWSDKATPLESHLTNIIAFFEIKAVEDKEKRERWRIEKIEDERKRLLEQKLRAEKEWEETKVQMLLEDSKTWKKAFDLRAFIHDVESKSSNPTEEVKDWLAWAKEKLDKLDPISNGIESLINKYSKPPENSKNWYRN